MKKKLLLIAFLLPLYAGAQVTLRGEAVSADVPVENVRITNASSNHETYTGQNGEFTIIANQNDTLIFSGMLVAAKVLFVTENMLKAPFKVNLDPEINTIEEVVVQKYKLTGNLEADSKNIRIRTPDTISVDLGNVRDMQFTDDYKSSPKNESMPVLESTLTGIDFKAIGKGIIGMLGGGKRDKIPLSGFVNETKARLPAKFFTETLKLEPEQVDIFLRFCENWLKAQPDEVYPHNEMALMEFLIAKREDFPDLK